MSVICPTVMGSTLNEYRDAINNIKSFAERAHIDFADGVFAPTKLVDIRDAWWPPELVVDFHVMYQKPLEYIEAIILKQPSLVVIHAEADGAEDFVDNMQGLGIDVGVALLKETPVSKIKPYINKLDHVLVFSGELGYYGGKTDFGLLDKVKEIKALKGDIEIGWDGGVNAETVKRLAGSGVDVLNVGGAIQKADNPEDAYAIMEALIDK